MKLTKKDSETIYDCVCKNKVMGINRWSAALKLQRFFGCVGGKRPFTGITITKNRKAKG